MKYIPEVNAFAGSDHDGLAQVMWHITDVCPLSCPYCFATKTGRAVGSGDVAELARILAELGVLKVDIGGGEPLAYRDLADVVRHLSALGVRMTITTSGAGAPARRRWLVSNLERFTRVIISIDGPLSLHDEMRGREGAFEGALGLVREITASGYPGVRVNTVVTSRLLSDGALGSLVQEIARLGPIEWCLIQPHKANASEAFDSYSVSDADFAAAVALVSGEVAKGPSRVTILSRRSIDYAGYWVLYPDRSLRMHTEGKDDYVGSQDIFGMGVQELKRVIWQRGQNVPTASIGMNDKEKYVDSI